MLNEIKHSKPISTTLFENEKIKITQTDKDSDDDEDDLLPYDLSNDIPLAKTNKPAYLRDCLDGDYLNQLSRYKSINLIVYIFFIALIFSEDPDKIEVSLKSVENLCETYHYELEEVYIQYIL